MYLDIDRRAARLGVVALRHRQWRALRTQAEQLVGVEGRPLVDARGHAFGELLNWLSMFEDLEGEMDYMLLQQYVDLLEQLVTEDNFLQVCRPGTARLLRQYFRNNFEAWILEDDDYPRIDTSNARQISRLFPALGTLLDTLGDEPDHGLVLLIEQMCIVAEELETEKFGRQHATTAPRAIRFVNGEPQPQRREDQDQNQNEDLEDVDEAEEEQWKQTGCCYGRPQIRVRPKYPRLPQEKKETPDKGTKCRKYFSTYSESKLTGGIMALWCRHRVALGFHCIPRSEGRNDVFAALFTRWPRAPSVVVYDFACALGAYCLTREYNYFKKTLFVIDEFHQVGHTSCSKACFLQTYMTTNAELRTLNSSAAESGNSKLTRIRKSLRYCSQRRAIIFTHHFLAISNRLLSFRIQRA